MQRLEPSGHLDDLLAPYAEVERRSRRRASWVLANMVAGLDGSTALGGRVGPLSEGADVELFRLLRSVADVVLVGAETFRREGYGPVELPAERRRQRVEHGRTPVPPLAIVTRSLELDWSSPAFAGTDEVPRPFVVTCEAADAARRERAAEHAEVVVAGDRTVDVATALNTLADRGNRVVLCEGGPTLLGELVDRDLLDELCLTLTPIMGGDPLPVAVTELAGPLTRFSLRHVLADRDDLFLRYEREVHRG